MDGPPHERESPLPLLLGGDREDGLGVSREPFLRNRANDTRRSADDYRRERYWLDGQIKRVLRADAKKTNPQKHPANVHRTVACTWVRIDNLSLVKPSGKGSYHYKGLATCGSVHACCICAAKIQERRRQELDLLDGYAVRLGKKQSMASFTFPHRIEQPLASLLQMQQAAIKFMREARAYKDLMREIGCVGRVRALEVTYGQNGWHPHTHEDLILDPRIESSWLKSKLAPLWASACTKAGLFRPGVDDEFAFYLHGVDVTDESVSSYLAKADDQSRWGISHEMTKSSSKQGRRSGSHPFKLAANAATHGLFLEFVKAMKGQRQLVWSRGLKAAVGVEEKTDLEIAEEAVTKVDNFIDLLPEAWHWITGNDARFEITHAAKTAGSLGVFDYLSRLGFEHPQDYRHGSGNVRKDPASGDSASDGQRVPAEGDKRGRRPVHSFRTQRSPNRIGFIHSAPNRPLRPIRTPGDHP